MEGPISFWGYKEQESNLILPEHDDDDDEIYYRKTVCQVGYLPGHMFTIYYHDTLLMSL